MEGIARIFDNPQNLPCWIVQGRLLDRGSDAAVEAYDVDRRDAAGSPTGETLHLVKVRSDLTAADVEAVLVNAASPAELAQLEELRQARAGFMSLPNWSTWSPQQASDYVTANILQGWSQAQADAYITSTATTIAGVQTVLKQVAAGLIAIRAILAALGMGVLYIRNLVVRMGR